MSTLDHRQHVATLWRLSWGASSLRCAIYRADGAFQLSVESDTAAIITERFDMKPRAFTRAQALRNALKRRGWVEQPLHDDPRPHP